MSIDMFKMGQILSPLYL